MWNRAALEAPVTRGWSDYRCGIAALIPPEIGLEQVASPLWFEGRQTLKRSSAKLWRI
jgi:hypothetical protein